MKHFIPPEDFLVEAKSAAPHFFGDPSSLKRESVLARKQVKPYVLTITDTSVVSPKRPGTPRPILSPTSGRVTTSFECGEFWRYFQNASQLALVVPGGGDAVVGRNEARQLLANFRGTGVESISKTDIGLMHICGLSVRQLHAFVSGLWRLGSAGMCVIKDLMIGSTKGPAKASLLRSQKTRIDKHIRSHSVMSAVYEKDDYLELGVDGDTREELPSPSVSPFTTPIGDLEEGLKAVSFEIDTNFEDEAKLEQPSLRVMKTSEFESSKAEEVRKYSLLGADSAARSSFTDNRYVLEHLHSISCSLMGWAMEDDVEDDVLSLGSYQLDDDECTYVSDSSVHSCDEAEERKSDSHSVAARKPSLDFESEEVIYMDYESLFRSPRRKASLSLSFSVSERLATIMHAPVGV